MDPVANSSTANGCKNNFDHGEQRFYAHDERGGVTRKLFWSAETSGIEKWV